MDFEFSPDQELLRETVRRYLAERAPMAYVREMFDDPRGTSGAVWAGLAGLGLTGILVPGAHGGAGMGMVDMGVVLEEMGRAVHPGPFLSSAVGAVSAALALGAPEYLPDLATGEVIGTLALLEPGRRSEWRSPATTGLPDGDGWVLQGAKAHVPDAGAADLFFVTAATDDGLGVFAVETETAGLAVEPTPAVDGTRKEATVTLDGAPGRRLGTGDATAALGGVLDRLLVALVVDGVGAAQTALDLSVTYAKERSQFGRPIGAFQAVQHLCADMLHDVELARAGAYYGLWACDAAPPGERHRAAVMAKAFAGDALARVGAAAIQVHGGIGFTWEHDVHLPYKRLLSLQTAYGGSVEHLSELADLVV